MCTLYAVRIAQRYQTAAAGICYDGGGIDNTPIDQWTYACHILRLLFLVGA